MAPVEAARRAGVKRIVMLSRERASTGSGVPRDEVAAEEMLRTFRHPDHDPQVGIFAQGPHGRPRDPCGAHVAGL